MKGIDRGRRERAVELVQMVAFSVGDGEYALDIMRIKEIINPVRVTAVPKAPSFIEGVIELRGAILPVVDLRKRFDLPAAAATRATKFLIVAIDVNPVGAAGERAQPAVGRVIVALIVDGVSEPLRVPKEEVRAAPALAQSPGSTAYFSGVVHHHDRILMILEIDAILSSTEKITLAGLSDGGGAR